MTTSTEQEFRDLQAEDPEYKEALKRVRKIKHFYKNLASWAGVSILLIALDFFINGGFTWSRYPVFFWGLSLIPQLFQVIRLQKFDNTWEQRQIRRFTGRAIPEDTPSPPLEDYSDELLNQKDREMSELSDYRKINKPWKEEDLV
jgi:hypothetical protein